MGKFKKGGLFGKAMTTSRERFTEELFQHQSLIHKICRLYRDTKEDQEDLFQEITYQLWKAYPQFQGRSKISTWMYRIGLNTAIATFRKPKVVNTEPFNSYEGLNFSDVDSAVERREQLIWAIKKLNEADRAIITLYLDDLSYQSIAEIMGISENYVGVRLNRIKAKIKKLLNL